MDKVGLRDFKNFRSLRNNVSFNTVPKSIRNSHPKAEYEREQKRLEKLYNNQQRGLAMDERQKKRMLDLDRKEEAKQRKMELERRAKLPTTDEILREIQFAVEQAMRNGESQLKIDSGRVRVEVRNSLQMSLRNISVSLDKIAKKYDKKNGNQHIAEGVNKLRDKIVQIGRASCRERV